MEQPRDGACADNVAKSGDARYILLCEGDNVPEESRLNESANCLREAKRLEGRQLLRKAQGNYVIISGEGTPLCQSNTRDETLESEGVGMHRASSDERRLRTQSQTSLDHAVTNACQSGSNMRNVAGCCHPKSVDECNVCTLGDGSISGAMGQFLNRCKLRNEYMALKSYRFQNARQLKNAYTFFNQRWSLQYKIAMRDYFLGAYPALSAALFRCRNAFEHPETHETEPMAPDANFHDMRGRRGTTRRAYCSFVYLPGGPFDYTPHIIHGKLPGTDLDMRFLQHAYGLPLEFLTGIVGTPSNKYIDESHFSERRAREASRMRKLSKETNTLSASDGAKQPTESKTGEYAGTEDADPREERLRAVGKSKHALDHFRSQGVRLIVLTKDISLPRRDDLILTQSDEYVNVFFAEVPENTASEEEALIWQS